MIHVGILGATGTVGQRFIQLLDKHPIFTVSTIGASSRSAGNRYSDQVNWKLATPIPDNVSNLTIQECRPELFKDCVVIFSALDSDVAGDIELDFIKADFKVFSNAKNFRMDPTAPLCVPLVNSDHMKIVDLQRKIKGLKNGFVVTNANCSTTGLVVALKALQDAFGPLKQVMVTTMQAISGAGYPGVPSLDIFDNVIPYISGEESKLETEPNKILGSLTSDGIEFKKIAISANCNRVAVIDGHTECVSVSFEKCNPTVEEVSAAFSNYKPPFMNVYSAPDQAIYQSIQPDRPQPRLDRDNGKGQAVTVGRIRKCPLFGIKFTLLSHNTVLGAAGSSIMNAEIAHEIGLLK